MYHCDFREESQMFTMELFKDLLVFLFFFKMMKTPAQFFCDFVSFFLLLLHLARTTLELELHLATNATNDECFYFHVQKASIWIVH